jgi:hypothetical protein
MAGSRAVQRWCALASAGLLAFMPQPSFASDVAPGPHFEAALRFGVAFPQVDYFATELDQTAYPISVDAGVRIGQLLFVGAYFSVAPTSVSQAFVDAISPCDTNCWARVFHFGLEVQLHPINVALGRGVSFDPWVGIGAGYEVQQQRYVLEGYCKDYSYCPVLHVGARRGPEWFNGQLGLALSFANLSVGPYGAASWGVYTIDAGKALSVGVGHWWLSAGLRLSWTPS